MIKHRTVIFILTFLLVSIPIAASAATQRGIVPVPIKDRSGNQVLLYQESHALLVGVSEYTGGWPNLPGVRKDITEVKAALEQKGFHTVVVINPTRVELRDAIENFINQYGQDVDNRLIFYFAGHGYTMKLSYGEEMGYFVPSDAPNPNLDRSGFLATSLNMESIEVYSKQVQSKHALFLFDSCFSGSIFALSRAIPDNIGFKTSKPVRQFITAGSADETVPDISIFNDQFIRALNGEGDLDGDGYLTGVELGEFLQKTVINYSKGSQHPQYGKIRNPNLDKGDFVFSLLDRSHIEQSVDSIIREREKLEQDRLNLEEERKRVVALERLKEEKRKLDEEKRRFKEEQSELARLKAREKEEDLNLGVMFPMDPFVVNLAGSEGKRFLKVTISLELSTPEAHVEIKENIQKINDSITVLLSSKAFEDVYSVQGKFKLKDEITTSVNRFLVVGHIKDAYFTEFIIQ
jgi:flagellar basal body-associated protein FliL